MQKTSDGARRLSAQDIVHFIEHGFVRIDEAFSSSTAAEARSILWRAMGLSADDPAGWRAPVVRLGQFTQEPFVQAANAPVLRGSYDQLAGEGRWLEPRALGTFPVRFPSPDNPGDTGWHVDVTFDTELPDFLEWRANIHSRGRALLMLFLFSDVGPDDAPTRIRGGSQRIVAEQLRPAGEAGLTLRQLAANDFAETAHLPESLATGAAGTVYLCHPFLVHAAQPHRGRAPKFMAQPPLLPTGDNGIDLQQPQLPLTAALG